MSKRIKFAQGVPRENKRFYFENGEQRPKYREPDLSDFSGNFSNEERRGKRSIPLLASDTSGKNDSDVPPALFVIREEGTENSSIPESNMVSESDPGRRWSPPKASPQTKTHEKSLIVDSRERDVLQPKRRVINSKCNNYFGRSVRPASREERLIRTFSHEVALYALFLAITTTIVFSMVDESAFYLRRGTHAIFMDTPFFLSSRIKNTPTTVEPDVPSESEDEKTDVGPPPDLPLDQSSPKPATASQISSSTATVTIATTEMTATSTPVDTTGDNKAMRGKDAHLQSSSKVIPETFQSTYPTVESPESSTRVRERIADELVDIFPPPGIPNKHKETADGMIQKKTVEGKQEEASLYPGTVPLPTSEPKATYYTWFDKRNDNLHSEETNDKGTLENSNKPERNKDLIKEKSKRAINEIDDYSYDENVFDDSPDSEKSLNNYFRLINNEDGGFSGGGMGIYNALSTANTMQDFWDFTENTLVRMLYWNFWYSNDDPVAHTEANDALVLYTSKLLGVARVRQVRVRKDTCNIHPSIQHLFRDCYGYYTGSNEDTSELFPGEMNERTVKAWNYTTASDLKSSNYIGTFAVYGGGGYYVDLAMDDTNTRSILKDLKDNLWLTRATRAVFIDFTMYNVNVNLFLVCKIIFEFPPTGGMIPYGYFMPMKFLRYVNNFDYIVLSLEFTFIIFVAFFTYEILLKIAAQRRLFLSKAWNYIDMAIILISYALTIMGLYRYFEIEAAVAELSEVVEKHPEFDYACNFQIVFNQICAVFLFVCWIKVLKFLRYPRSISEVRRTLERSLKAFLGFAILFSIILLAFAQLGYLIFGTEVKHFRTVWTSCIALLSAIPGRLNFEELEEANGFFGPMFIMLFIFSIIFIFVNIFAAIIIESYIAIKSQIVPNRRQRIKGFWSNILPNFGMKHKNVSAEERTKEDIGNALKRAGFSNTEIEIFFAQYDIKADDENKTNEVRKLINDLELKRFDFQPVDITLHSLQSEIDKLKHEVHRLSDKGRNK